MKRALRQLAAGIEERLLLNESGAQVGAPAASSTGTPLILSVLSLIVAIVTVLVALANVQRQLQVAARACSASWHLVHGFTALAACNPNYTTTLATTGILLVTVGLSPS
jgi:hypothetical protein